MYEGDLKGLQDICCMNSREVKIITSSCSPKCVEDVSKDVCVLAVIQKICTGMCRMKRSALFREEQIT